jgi:hypothetical protein
MLSHSVLRPAVFSFALLASLSAASFARADAVEKRARDAYERGSAAYDRKDYDAAAHEFAEADSLVPNPTALRAALDAAVLADDPVLGMELLDRARRAPADDALGKLMYGAETRFAHRTGRLRVACGEAPCLVAVDGAALDAGAPGYVKVGAHAITIQCQGRAEQRIVDVKADDVLTLSPAPAPAPPPAPGPAPAPQPASGVSPAWFFVALGAAAVAGGLTALPGVDAKDKHDAFVGKGCGSVGVTDCAALSTDGAAATLRTNIGLAVTGALALTAVGIGVFAVRWRQATVTVGVASAALHVSFR